jgi:hypothetical protein
MNLFAYGSLMVPEGLRAALGERAGGLRYRVAVLRGWRRIWNAYREEWGGGVLNLEPHQGGVVVGVVIEGLTEDDFALLDLQEATHLPRRVVYVACEGEEAVAAQLYSRQRANHTGKPSDRYRAILLIRARDAGAAVYDNLVNESVDGFGNPIRLLPA